jgi:hypothetical protein
LRTGLFTPLVFVLAALPLAGQPQTKLRPETKQAFRDYTAEVERSWGPRKSGVEPFLKVWGDAEGRQKLLAGEVLTRFVAGYKTQVPNGHVHHWLSAVLVPGVDLVRVSGFLRDSERQVDVYPEVVSIEVLERRDGYQKIKTRMVKRQIITVAADTVGAAYFDSVGPKRLLVRGYTLQVNEIVNLGKPDESLRPVGEGKGMFWSLNGYWWAEETADGVVLELETIALTRGIPTGLGWLVAPFLKTVPKRSMSATMVLTRDAILNYGGAAGGDGTAQRHRLESK